ncbi:very short patch repair endonuclease [Sphingomonas sp. NFR15]|uniref:very short patch repair endonuclease n=1 Tax=Sphingomonas sp. NFR15 TaxID=1566282 RepID=UPI00210D3D88|nr:DNA mismatch endonuclease Vsr [Sphingomonas sp. NFR15]
MSYPPADRLQSRSSPDKPVTPARSALMARIGPRDTKPEMVVRRLLHALGRRFRLHRRDLPGTPDIVLPGSRKAIFVHGCFWHRHEGCPKATTPKTRSEFWQDKFDRNVERDERKEADLRAAGWDVTTVWECETRDLGALEIRLRDWLETT